MKTTLRIVAISVTIIAMQIMAAAQPKAGATQKPPVTQKPTVTRKVTAIPASTSAAKLAHLKALLMGKPEANLVNAHSLIDDVVTFSVQQPSPKNGFFGVIGFTNPTSTSPADNYAYFDPPKKSPQSFGVTMVLALPSGGDYLLDISCVIDDASPQSPKTLVLSDLGLASGGGLSVVTTTTSQQTVQVTDGSHHVFMWLKGVNAGGGGLHFISLEQGSWEFDSVTLSHVTF